MFERPHLYFFNVEIHYMERCATGRYMYSNFSAKIGSVDSTAAARSAGFIKNAVA